MKFEIKLKKYNRNWKLLQFESLFENLHVYAIFFVVIRSDNICKLTLIHIRIFFRIDFYSFFMCLYGCICFFNIKNR